MSSPKLTPKQRRHLKALGHHLKPLVIVGKEGITKSLVEALEQALLDHELVKVRLGSSATDQRHEAADELADRASAQLASVIGKTMLIYKAHPDKPKIKLPPPGES